jgi:hypothetical protein
VFDLQVTEEGKQERNLVVSAGNYTVIWNFMRVKDSNHDCYKYAAENSYTMNGVWELWGKFWFLHPLICCYLLHNAWILEHQNVISFGICKRPYATSGKTFNQHWVLLESSTKVLPASFSACLPLTQSKGWMIPMHTLGPC